MLRLSSGKEFVWHRWVDTHLDEQRCNFTEAGPASASLP
jgi:hypothetical protein